ncbi:MAG TPA: type II toxin-antitoxin system VapC family toxin [Pirellulales bacterium]|nr:type II toxin-antitoxin system VapC family toxin [Pirellulales bacterium]
MPEYLLDTNILRYWYDTTCLENARVVSRVNAARQPDFQTGYISRLYVSVITLGEIEYGHRVALAPDPAKQGAYRKFVREQCPVALEMTKHVAERYGEIRAWLFIHCSPNLKKSKAKRAEELVNPTTGKELGIDENDIWIAAQAKTHNLVLVTHDARGNFGKVLRQFAADLTVEDWAS